jgi:AcrR family transcriptional regulator
MGRKATDSRERILNAAMRIAGTSGGEAVTVEAVAKATKLSKAGVLYYFPSKDHLLEALVAEVVRHYEEAISSQLKRGKPGSGSYMRALIDARVRPDVDKAFYGLLTACASRPELLAPIDRMYQRCRAKQIEDGLDPTLCAIISYAVEGLLFRAALGANDLSAHDQKAVQRTLKSWTTAKGD